MTTETLFTLLTLWVIKPLLVCCFILVGMIFLRKKSAALQHFWLASGIFALILLPILTPIIPSIPWQVLPAQDSDSQGLIMTWCYWLVTNLQQPHWLLVISASYFLVASWLLSYFCLGVWLLRQQTRAASHSGDIELQTLLQQLCFELGIGRKITLCVSPTLHSPHTWGLYRPTIMLPSSASQWTSERKLAVLIHELGHIARWDWAITILVKVVCALFWFLPPVWWLVARLEQHAEMACDDFIYRLREQTVNYAENLLALALTPAIVEDKSYSPALPMAGHAPIYYRIQAILDQRRSHAPVAPETGQYWVLIIILLLLPLTALQVMPIREVLLAQLWLMQQPINVLTLDTVTTAATNKHTTLIDASYLKALKQELFNQEFPEHPTRSIEQIKVIAEWPEFVEPLAGQVLPIAFEPPLILVESYIPLQTIVPQYPRAALQRGLEGWVEVQFTIALDGSVVDPIIVHAQPRKVFDRAVLTALKEWRYQPQTFNNNPVLLKGVTEVFTFQLASSSTGLHSTDPPRR